MRPVRVPGLFLAVVLATWSHAWATSADADAAVLALVRAADDERVAATIAQDRARLEAVLSDALHYAHSNGVVEAKAAFIDAVVAGRLVYQAIVYNERRFDRIAPDVVLMSGRALIDARRGEQPVALDLHFLAVWRLEGSGWRFVAWQSSRAPAPAAPK